VVLATFTVPNPAVHLGDLSASISWGDGNISAGTQAIHGGRAKS